ncbi:MAG TPA: ABC transporter substrate-binding protein, partial [Burkholderiales bacterium]|nr:ABC transporter substrate-binding protein [Burkholderiales bacterium]
MLAAGALAGASFFPKPARAQSAKIKLGLMLPYSGTFAQLGTAIENGLRLALDQGGGKLGGREVEFFKVDDESDPSKATDNANRLITRDKVDVLIGSVHSGVAMGMVKVARESGTLTLIPNAGADAATGPLCSSNVFRTSFSNWQPVHPLGKVMAGKGHKKAVFITWKYAAGEESLASFKEGFTAAGGEVVKELFLPFPNVEFQALLTEIAAVKPDAVACFFAGGGAVKFVKDYAAAGLKDKIPLYGSGFLTEGVLAAQGEAAEGLMTTLHYADSLDLPRNKSFRSAYAKTY